MIFSFCVKAVTSKGGGTNSSSCRWHRVSTRAVCSSRTWAAPTLLCRGAAVIRQGINAPAKEPRLTQSITPGSHSRCTSINAPQARHGETNRRQSPRGSSR